MKSYGKGIIRSTCSLARLQLPHEAAVTVPAMCHDQESRWSRPAIVVTSKDILPHLIFISATCVSSHCTFGPIGGSGPQCVVDELSHKVASILLDGVRHQHHQTSPGLSACSAGKATTKGRRARRQVRTMQRWLHDVLIFVHPTQTYMASLTSSKFATFFKRYHTTPAC
jgi:hypothetical protein